MRRSSRVAAGLGIALALVACGVAGQPLPPGPVPPAAPRELTARSAPDALEVTVAGPTTDLDGEPLGEPLEVLLFTRPTCDGPPAARGPAGEALRLPPSAVTVRAVAVRDGRAGPPGPPTDLSWSPPPGPPEAPVAFAGDRGVEISWLPPAGAESVRILRDGEPRALVPAADVIYTDTEPPPGRHGYSIIALGPGWRTAPSPEVQVEVQAGAFEGSPR